MKFRTIEWKNNRVVMLDQRLLPGEEIYQTYSTYQEVAEAIKTMVIRGAPAIGVAGAMGLALGAQSIKGEQKKSFLSKLEKIAEEINSTRPTAVNLSWGLNRMMALAKNHPAENGEALTHVLIEEVKKMVLEDIEINHMMGNHGAALITNGDHVLTHCNAGALATAGFGTALGVLYAAWAKGVRFDVYADETRPFLQGARLTAWELSKNDIPVTVITDSMAGWLMKKKLITKVIVGADRIAANGDVANKIGTYSVALLAKHHNIPFYVAAPLSTIDLSTPSGNEIPIEERPQREVTHVGQTQLTPEAVKIRNPAFDVTPNELVAAIITEKGIAKAPYTTTLKAFYNQS